MFARKEVRRTTPPSWASTDLVDEGTGESWRTASRSCTTPRGYWSASPRLAGSLATECLVPVDLRDHTLVHLSESSVAQRPHLIHQRPEPVDVTSEPGRVDARLAQDLLDDLPEAGRSRREAAHGLYRALL